MKIKLPFGYMIYMGRGVPVWVTGDARQVTVYKAEHQNNWYTTPELALKSAPRYMDIKITQKNLLKIGNRFFETKELNEIEVYDKF